MKDLHAIRLKIGNISVLDRRTDALASRQGRARLRPLPRKILDDGGPETDRNSGILRELDAGERA